MDTLQSLVLPNLEVNACEDMYVRLNDRAWSELGEPRLHFLENGILHTDTFYGSFSATTWRRHCQIETLLLALHGQGRFVVSFALHRLGQATVWLGERTVTLSAAKPALMTVPGWEGVKEGLVYFRLRALQPGVIEGARYLTADAALNDVRLGLVITHFNRQSQVLPAIERIRRSVLTRPDLRDRVTLTVVDNSRNLPLSSQAGVKLIPNRNLGGTGGFVRGLLDLVDGGEHTHALFMDDDASCEPESIARTCALLRYARNSHLAVAGALLNEAHPSQLIEKGARFDGECKPICHGMDMRRPDHLILADRSSKPDYGGWWFFAFGLDAVKRYPFPFFVRGDDVFFSLTNRFELATMHGIACFGEEFRLKHGPMTAYLDSRYHLLHALLDERRGAGAILKLAKGHFLRPLSAYQYSTARAFTLAMKHLALGPDFFRKNIDLGEVRAQIASWTPAEKMVPVERSGMRTRAPFEGRESALRRLGRALTLQAFLLPRALLMDRVAVQEKDFHGDPSSVFRCRKVLYEHQASGTGYIVEYDRSLFFAALGDFVRTLAVLLARLPALRRAHAAGMEEMGTPTFWRQVYGLPLAVETEGAPRAANDGKAAPGAQNAWPAKAA